MRGPAVVAGPLTPAGVPATRTRRDRFDGLVLEVVDELERSWADELGQVEFAVEETPVLPDGCDSPTVPLSSLVTAPDGKVRLVVFRRPIELRAASRDELSALILTVLVEQVSELLNRPPGEIHPRYED